MIRYLDKVLPSQPYFAEMYLDGERYDHAVVRTLADFAAAFDDDKCAVAKPANAGCEELSSAPVMLALLAFLIRTARPQSILEIGTFIGKTTMFLASIGDGRASITTIERGAEFAEIARKNFAANGLGSRIRLLEGDAAAALTALEADGAAFDLIFLDGGKEDYLAAAIKCEELLSARGLLVIDDVFFHGDALNGEPRTRKGLGCRAILDRYRNHPGFHPLLLPLCNGVLIVMRAVSDVGVLSAAESPVACAVL